MSKSCCLPVGAWRPMKRSGSGAASLASSTPINCVTRVILTDKLKSYGAAKREILPGVEHCQHRYLNNRAENSHQPTRQRERRMQGFKSTGHAQRFLAAYGPIAQHFRPRRHRYSAPEYRQVMRARYQMWGEITGTELA